MKRHALQVLLIALAFSSRAGATDAPDTHLEQALSDVNARYESEWKQIRAEGDALERRAPDGPEVAVGIDLDCEMKRQEIKLDIPEVSMKRSEMSLDLPQVSMKRHRMSWDNPETYMETTTCGYYPEFHGLKVKMSPIKCDLPQVRMVRREVSLDVPEFRWDRTHIVLDLPEFRMVTQRWSFDLPDCRISDVSVESRRIKDDADQLQKRAASLAERQESEIRALSAAHLVAKRQQVESSFNQAGEALQRAIAHVREHGIDPSSVRQQSGPPLDLLARLVELQNRRQEELAKLDTQIEALSGGDTRVAARSM